MNDALTVCAKPQTINAKCALLLEFCSTTMCDEHILFIALNIESEKNNSWCVTCDHDSQMNDYAFLRDDVNLSSFVSFVSEETLKTLMQSNYLFFFRVSNRDSVSIEKPNPNNDVRGFLML